MEKTTITLYIEMKHTKTRIDFTTDFDYSAYLSSDEINKKMTIESVDDHLYLQEDEKSRIITVVKSMRGCFIPLLIAHVKYT